MTAGSMSKFLQRLRRTLHPRDEADPTDGQLLEDFIGRRDEAAFAVLVRRHGPMVWSVCRRVLRSPQDAEDAFQATFLVLVRKAASIVSRELLANWLYGVAHRTALKAKATAAKRQRKERPMAEMPEPEAALQDRRHHLLPLLDQALSNLPDKYRVAIVLCDLEGKTRKEAARQLGCPEGTVAGRLARARTMLAERLARHGVEISGASLAVMLSENAVSAGMPISVVSSTIEAASRFAAGQAAATGAISAKVAALTEGVLKAMLLTKLKSVMAVMLVVAMIGVGAGLLGYGMATGEQNENKKGDALAPQKEVAKSNKEAAKSQVEAKSDEPQKPASPSRSIKGDYSFSRLSLSPDGKTLATVTLEANSSEDNIGKKKNAVLLWDLQTGSIKRTIAENQVKDHHWSQAGVGFSPDGKIVAAATTDDKSGSGLLMLWDAETGKLVHQLKHNLPLVQSFAFSPDGKTVATGTGGNIDRDFETVKLWDVKTGKLLRTLETTNKMAVGVAFAPNSKLLAAVLQQDRTLAEVILWNAAEEKQPQTLPDSDGIYAIVFSPDGKTLVGAARNKPHKLRVWDVTTGKTIQSSDLETHFSDAHGSVVALSPDGMTLAISGKEDDKYVIAVFDVKTAKRTKTLKGHEGVSLAFAFSPERSTLASGSEDQTIYLWDFDRGTKRKK
jgi:RNA polymerase sigma factor (sigma-70 family)